MTQINRIQERLFKKNLEKFAKTFGTFSIYQLTTIRKLIDDLIERKRQYEK